MSQLSKAIELLGTAVALVLLAGAVLVLLKANRVNDIVEAIRDAADWLAGPFNDMFELSTRRRSIAVNWAIAAVVYYAASRLLAGFVSRRA
jgi:lysylphosphatidylglycerol synthetase-like protein (DUF2156 family)